ncbi:DUF3311 domain-containing protein [Brevibacillus nitrificans]|uniref:DUF3311 domain-containing protein n=1 Tax=Brevibacillus nitrificans TaxID=651560 RepID=A0A3M8D6K3_9BACL|nr:MULTISPECIES: DUF3311 domain-containing protein [Brevibacillus]MED1951213.1 DUF3311 domain-containing protein [Brevibacillus centrosporus]RNB83686.1 DUF3311 domain-containing protein [Brevibacillus nitrificans]
MRKIHFVLSVLPFVGSLVVINRVEPYVLGMPFVMFWAVLWMVLTSVCLLISNKLLTVEKEEE